MEQVILRFTIFQMNQIKDCIVKIKKAVLKLTALFLVKDTLAISKLNNIILNLNKRFIINFKLMLKYSHHKLIFFISKKTCN